MKVPLPCDRRAVTLLTALILAGLLGLPSIAVAQGAADPVGVAVQQMERAAGAPVATTRSAVSGLVTFMSASPTAIPVASSAKRGALPSSEMRARAFLTAHGRAFGIANANDLAKFRSGGPDSVGMEHVRFHQLYQGVPVTGGELTVHLRGSGVVAVNAKTLDIPEKLSTTPTVDASAALAAAKALIAKHFGIADAVFSSPRLEVFNRGMLEGRSAVTRLAWFIEARRIDLRQFIWIDAETGGRLLDFSQLADALNRQIFTAGGGSTLPGTLVRAEGDPPTMPEDADVDNAYDFAGDTYNYYLTEHGRDSFDGAGAQIISSVHYCPTDDDCNYQNAFWNGTQMVYGNDFSKADDVDAHELTHAVTDYSATLFYYMQSGALNESFSDIFGETVDLLNGHGNDAPDVRWLIGEDLPVIGAIRNMMNPNQFDDPAKMSDFRFGCDSNIDQGGVHSNSGVSNHAYALMVDGGTYNGFTINGIGLIKAGKIEYRTLTHYLLSGSDFLDDYNALKQSCVDLVGVAGITLADCTEVGKALDAVEMASPLLCQPPQPVSVSYCPAGQRPSDIFFDNLENTASGKWAISPLAGVTHWTYPAPESKRFATSGVQNFWGNDASTIGDSAIAMTSSVALPAGARLQFNHAFGFEHGGTTDNYDGGVVEYSTDGGVSWTDAGGLFAQGAGYGGAISSCCSNPLGGRVAFVKDSYGYTASQFSLASLAGQSVRFRFRMGTDESVGDTGWFIDDVRIYQCVPGSSGQSRDFNGDGRADILWRHTGGSLFTWFLNGATVTGTGSPGFVGPDWTVAGAADFNGDGKADILWRHATGTVYTWLLNGTTVSGSGSPGSAPTDWSIAGIGDFNGDGKADILWRHTSGTTFIWLLNGTTVIGTGSPGSVATDWSIVGVGDFNGDGKADILWRHSSGVLVIWFLDGTTVTGTAVPGSAPTDWSVAGIGDFNGDGKADILWRHTSGTTFVWLLNGTTVIGSGSPGSTDPSWVVQ